MTTEDEEILAKISRVAGQINRRKNENAGFVEPRHYHPYHPASRPFRGRGGYGGRGRAPIHRHRTLILNGKTPGAEASDGASNSSWVTKNDRHLQLINTSVYEKEAEARTRAIGHTEQQKQAARDAKERSKLLAHLNRARSVHGTGAGATNATKHELEIQGIRFYVSSDGSKLTKAPDDINPPKATPKMTTVGGVRFYRSKNGNLYRHGIVKAQRQTGAVKKTNTPCQMFSTTGSCSKGPRCRYLHDPTRVAVCTHFLQKQECFNGDACDLSHDLTPERTPTCMHFLRDGCMKPNCRYAHNKTNPTAPVCRAFGLYGYCAKGLDCTDRHVAECPDFANQGKCKTKGCKLLHRERASVLRKAEENGSGGDESDLTSDDDGESVDSYEVDSDEVDEFIGRDGVRDSSFADQHDFIEL